MIVDAQSVKNTDTANEKGYDAGKKVSGIKRHICVDSNGLPHAMAITTADITDRKGALAALAMREKTLQTVQCVIGDGGYTGEPFAQGVEQLIGAKVEIVKRTDLNQFKVLPKRWVVERSFSWLEKNRRLWKNCERLTESSMGMMIVAFLVLILKRF